MEMKIALELTVVETFVLINDAAAKLHYLEPSETCMSQEDAIYLAVRVLELIKSIPVNEWPK